MEFLQSLKCNSEVPLRLVIDVCCVWKEINNAKSRSDERITKQNACVEDHFLFAKIATAYAKLSDGWASKSVSKLSNIAIVTLGGLHDGNEYVRQKREWREGIIGS
jgi:hypothetical protein